MSLLPPDLRDRSPGPELMDDHASVGQDELRGALGSLRAINRTLGGHSTTRAALDDLASRVALPARVDILDVGGGSGDAAGVIVEWAAARGVRAEVVVIDIHAAAAEVAARRLRHVPQTSARCGDLFDVEAGSFDIVHAGLLLHHFDGDTAAHALAAMARAARLGVAVNDLRRHAVPWTLIRWITLVASRNRLIRSDAPLSVARGFKADDWARLGPAAGLDLRWRRTWAWRWAVSGVHTAAAR